MSTALEKIQDLLNEQLELQMKIMDVLPALTPAGLMELATWYRRRLEE